jgi:hypothetical protein
VEWDSRSVAHKRRPNAGSCDGNVLSWTDSLAEGVAEGACALATRFMLSKLLICSGRLDYPMAVMSPSSK